MRKIRFFTDEMFSKVGSFLAGGYAFLSIIGFAITVFVYHLTSYDLIIEEAISILFYIFIASYFIKARNNMFLGYYAISALIICNFIIPIITGLIGIILNSIVYGTFGLYILGISSIFALVYFILMCVNYRKRKKGLNTALIVFGALLFACSIVTAISNVYFNCNLLITTISAGAYTGFDLVIHILDYLIRCLASLFSGALCIVFFMYPAIARKSY